MDANPARRIGLLNLKAAQISVTVEYLYFGLVRMPWCEAICVPTVRIRPAKKSAAGSQGKEPTAREPGLGGIGGTWSDRGRVASPFAAWLKLDAVWRLAGRRSIATMRVSRGWAMGCGRPPTFCIGGWD